MEMPPAAIGGLVVAGTVLALAAMEVVGGVIAAQAAMAQWQTTAAAALPFWPNLLQRVGQWTAGTYERTCSLSVNR